ncbi:ATP-utilizing chromatin assembly and remodelling N-terminal-domain-containing protein [Schizophyllum amplum]|uniref:ATP-utilizing chromatin assembly and remodelling N-terminal-domain-containing protein n=1 Tax=Schizophyllum amplum TaxID=97359 RepID=A0A550CM03_9AGAR|nr:ATP-utilizing chromatin assembly and remodelling N-terminal-domain-containing protein [Auriculariopsis ampla]
MPTCRRKRVLLTQPSAALLKAVQAEPDKPVFFLKQTGEIFETYEAYAARMSFYRLKQFQCEVTGKSGLDYFQAVESERQEARTLHARFSAPLKPAVLKAVQWQVMGRLDHLVEAVFDRFKDRYFKDERILVDISGVKYHAKIEKVFPPKYSSNVEARDHLGKADASSSTLEEEGPPHLIGGDLSIPVNQTLAKDDPCSYFYWVTLLELERDPNSRRAKAPPPPKDDQMLGSVMEVQCGMMSRDRLSFSKSILRRFIRDCVDRDPAVASPWVVKPAIAAHYGVSSNMPEETRQGVNAAKKGEMDKRKKNWEDKEGPPAKKQKKMTAAQEEKARVAASLAQKKEREKAEAQKAKEEAERLAVEKKKKKPIRYPTEDLDVRLADKDKNAGMRLDRPLASRQALPFNESPGTFESFLLAWNFINGHGQALRISSFTLDEFEHALEHNEPDEPCPLLAEVHFSLLDNLRTVPFHRHSALLSLLQLKDQYEARDADDSLWGISMQSLINAMAEVGSNWERVPARVSKGREGWESALVGCLKDHASLQNFPRLREVLTRLLFDEAGNQTEPDLTYPYLPAEDRIAILAFMCDVAISSKGVHQHMEQCEEQLTALRKEKIEVNRQKKQYIEDMNNLMAEIKAENAKNGVDEDVLMNDAVSETSETPVSEGGDTPVSTGSMRKGKGVSLQKKVRVTAHTAQRLAARAKQSSAKRALAEHRRLDEEVNKLERRLEGIERDFRRLLGGVRVKPLGRDRFYNRVWWFDGLGSVSLLANGGAVQYGTGRIFIQGPSEFDQDILQRREEDIEERRQEEETPEGMLGPGDWAVYTEVEELERYIQWLHVKGHRELALKNTLTKWWPHITAGMRKRNADLNAKQLAPEARRSSRKVNASQESTKEPYMLWTNRLA